MFASIYPSVFLENKTSQKAPCYRPVIYEYKLFAFFRNIEHLLLIIAYREFS